MRVKDLRAWSEQCAEFAADEMSMKFRDFLVLWVDTADTLLSDSNAEISPRAALSKGFVVAEQTLGFLSVEWLGQMLLVIVQHWVDGEALWETLSVWERRMVEQATALKLTELQETARVSAEGPQSTILGE